MRKLSKTRRISLLVDAANALAPIRDRGVASSFCRIEVLRAWQSLMVDALILAVAPRPIGIGQRDLSRWLTTWAPRLRLKMWRGGRSRFVLEAP